MRSLPSRQRQRGVALMAMLAVLILGAAWWTVTAFSNPVSRTAEQRARNAQVLQQAKTALMGWVAHQAAMAAEADPGRLPCPELAANIGTADQGFAPTPNGCALPAVGRLPWRTLGLDQLRDASGEPLWYVVSAGWTNPVAGVNTTINSNTTGAITLDNAGDVVALIIAPGAPLSVAASANCAARNQARTAPSPAINFRDYLECQNALAGTNAFVGSGPDGSFNDQVLAITGAELLPLIEAAVAHRFERDIAPQIRATYAGWAVAPAAGTPLPFAAPFGDPTASTFQGTFGTRAGLMPLSLSETSPGSGVACTVGAQGVRCAPAFVAWTAPVTFVGADLVNPTCTVTPTQINCSYHRRCFIVCLGNNVAFTLTARASNVGMALRQLNEAANITNVAGANASGALSNTDGSATITLTGQAGTAGAGTGGLLGQLLCGGVLGLLQVCKAETISVPIALLADHAVFDPANAAVSWFFRNNWHQVSYYVVAPEAVPGGAGCGACLTVNLRNVNPAPHAALIAISGRSLNGAARPNATSTDWLEDTNCDLAGGVCAPDTTFAVRAPSLQINRQFNDRIAVLGP